MRAIFIMLLALSPVLSNAAAPVDYVADGHRGFHEVLLRCPERIWPGMDWSKTQFLFASSNTRQAWLIGANYQQPELLPAAEVPAVAFAAPYSFLDFRGIRTVTISIDMPFFNERITPFNLAVHEIFHNVGQRGWTIERGSRGTLVPMNPRPRYIRGEIGGDLNAALTDNNRLTDAANWFAAWQTEFPAEQASATDGYEGTAQYVEFLTGAMQEHGCDISNEALTAEVQEHIGEFKMEPGIPFDGEGYLLGSLAGLLLDLGGVNWKADVATGITPLKKILAGKNTGKPGEDAALFAEYGQVYAKLNAEVDQWRLPFEARLNDAEYVRVSVPSEWLHGAFSPKGFYIPEARPALTYTPFNGEHNFTGSNGEFITVADGSVGYSEDGVQVCSSSFAYFLVAKTDINEVSGTFTVTQGELKMEAGGAYQTDADGFTYLCAAPMTQGVPPSRQASPPMFRYEQGGLHEKALTSRDVRRLIHRFGGR